MWDKEKLKEIEAGLQRWEESIPERELAKEEVGRRATALEFAPKRVYTPLDVADLDYLRDCGFPGEYPYLRGIHATMYRGQLWSMAEYAGFGLPEETNERFRYLLAQGQKGVSVACDLPTQLGYDPDDPVAGPEVGVIGVSMPSLREMETVFAGLPLDEIHARGSINATHIIYWAMYFANAQKKGVPLERLSGTIVSDCLQEYLARGNYIFPPRHAMRLSLDTIEYCLQHAPRMNFLISVNSVREAGASLVQEAAFALAIAMAFLEGAAARGIDVDRIAPRLAFNFSVQMNFFEEIAKFRALRRLWAKIVKEKFGAKQPASCWFRAGPGTSGAMLTAQEPENNIVRVTIEALAAILGGVQYLHTSSYDEAHAIPTEKAVTIALRTQQIIAYETGIPEVVDPLGGSYYVEALTNAVEKAVVDYLRRIESAGGIVAAVETGWAQREIAESAYIFQKKIESGQRVVVGVNKFRPRETAKIEIHRANPRVVKEMQERVKRLREQRDNKAVSEALARLRRAAEDRENLMPFVIEAVKAYATMGEICRVFREVFGEYKEPAVV